MKYPNRLACLGAALSVLALLGGSTALHADAIPYPFHAQIFANTPLYATSTAIDVEYYYGFSAGDTDEVNLIDVTKGTDTGFIFTNQTTAPGTTATLGVNIGDLIVVELYNESTGSYFYSNTGAAPICGICSASADGANHAYVTSFSGGLIPGSVTINTPNGVTALPGTFVGLEDLDAAQGTDWDYNDDQLILTGVSGGTPEPSSLVLLGTGLLSAAGLLFQRRKTV